jgi:hypothetical protein
MAVLIAEAAHTGKEALEGQAAEGIGTNRRHCLAQSPIPKFQFPSSKFQVPSAKFQVPSAKPRPPSPTGSGLDHGARGTGHGPWALGPWAMAFATGGALGHQTPHPEHDERCAIPRPSQDPATTRHESVKSAKVPGSLVDPTHKKPVGRALSAPQLHRFAPQREPSLSSPFIICPNSARWKSSVSLPHSSFLIPHASCIVPSHEDGTSDELDGQNVRASHILRPAASKSKGSGASASTTHRRRQPIRRFHLKGWKGDQHPSRQEPGGSSVTTRAESRNSN